MNKIILGLDLDGVLYDWHSAVYTFFQYEKGYDGSYHDFWMEYFNTLSEEAQKCICGLPILYETQIPPKHVVDFLDFVSKNADVYYITHRPESCAQTTRNYVKRWNFPFYDNLYVTKDKLTTARLLGITHFLDDHVKHVKAVSQVADAYLMAKCWNFEFQNDYKTVYGLNDFRKEVFGQ